jgi:sugar (pentulose or hexulose) kinase
MWLLQQCREKWLKEYSKDISWDDIMNIAKNTPSKKSYINVDAMDFVVATTDMPQTIRQFCKNSGQTVPEGIGEIARVIYDSIPLKLKGNLKTLENLTGKKLDFIHMIGGGTKDVLLCQWIADATGIPVYAGPAETASVGNLLMQLKAAGEIKDLDEGRQIALRSANIKNYVPGDREYWDILYKKFIQYL